jgi:hypothetical protein
MLSTSGRAALPDAVLAPFFGRRVPA